MVAVYGRWPVFGELPGSIGLIRRGDQFLLQWRSDGLGWGFPGGTARWKESPERTLRREIREETGLRVISCRSLFTFVDRTYLPVRTSVFAVEAEGEPRSSWEGSVAWRSIPSEPFFASHRPILAYLQTHSLPLG
ncbi:MAG: NUDIX hydrolase [Terriglobales bacterium]